jgi:hypothetical protein
MIFILIYLGLIFFGFFFGFSFKGILILILGGVASSIANFVFNDVGTANIISYIAGAIAFYFFIIQETSGG